MGKNKYVIYTVMVGGYEDILQPLVIDNRFDFILFSNDFTENSIGVWQIRPIPEVILGDNKRLSRYPKAHPESMLAEYDASLYIDANIQITDKWVYSRFVDLAAKHEQFAGVKLILTGRDCIYDHALDMCLCGAEHDYNAVCQLHELYKKGFPRHYGLNENNIIFRSHTALMQETDEEWWKWILNFSFRDQFSYMYCLWHHNVPITYFLPEGLDHRNCQYFKFSDHNKRENVSKTKWVKKSICERIRNLYFSAFGRHSNAMWHKCYKHDDPLDFLKLNITTKSLLLLPFTLCGYCVIKCFNKFRSIASTVIRKSSLAF